MLRIIDTKTYGLQRRIVEITSVGVIDGKAVNPMSHLARPNHPISPQAMTIHRIIKVMAAGRPWIEDVTLYYYGSEQYVAYNASFDYHVLPEMLSGWVCTMKPVRHLWPGIKYNSMALHEARKPNVQTPPSLYHHRTSYSCYIIAALLIDIMNISGWMAEQMVDIIERPSLVTAFAFGGYRGKVVSDIAERNPGYLYQLFNNLDNMSPELCLAPKRYLENT